MPRLFTPFNQSNQKDFIESVSISSPYNFQKSKSKSGRFAQKITSSHLVLHETAVDKLSQLRLGKIFCMDRVAETTRLVKQYIEMCGLFFGRESRVKSSPQNSKSRVRSSKKPLTQVVPTQFHEHTPIQ